MSAAAAALAVTVGVVGALWCAKRREPAEDSPGEEPGHPGMKILPSPAAARSRGALWAGVEMSCLLPALWSVTGGAS